ncbi:MAG: hypothetical protein WD557_16935 [Dehalococcoidia bacterium]
MQSPVGARCRDCARILRSPIYTLSSMQMVRAIAAALIGGVVMGLIWAFILRPFSFGLLSIFLGVGLAWVFTKLMNFATGLKRGPTVVTLASVGILIAWAIQLLFLPLQLAAYGLLAVGIGIYLAYQNLR